MRRVLVQTLRELRSSHRGRLDIIASVLQSTLGGVRKTSIMYRCNLSFRQLEVYLGFLLRKDLLRMVNRAGGNSSRFFETTDRGLDFLRAFRDLDELMSK